MTPEDRPRYGGGVEEYSFDELAKGVASGTISRGRALKLAGSAALGAVLAFTPLSRMALAGDTSCTDCKTGRDTGVCSTINPDKPFQPCCSDTSTLSTPGPQVPSNCNCFSAFQQTSKGEFRREPICLPGDQSCRSLQKCDLRSITDRPRDFPRCPQGSVCVLGTCCNTPTEFNKGIGVCVQREKCSSAGPTATSRATVSGPTLTKPA